jgi:hypothetical protein
MMRITVFYSVLIVLLLASVPALSQGVPGCYPPPLPSVNRCLPSRTPPPIARTVRVDVPVPCAPVACGPTLPCSPHPCARPVCAPPPPTQPVQVRVDVVVRPEAPRPCLPQRFCCENPPIFEPIFCQAAGLAKSLIAAPLFLGERLLGHCVPLPMPAPCPMPCWRMPPPMCSPPVPCGLGRPPVKVMAPTACGPAPTRTRPPSGPFPTRRQYR